MSIFKFLLDLIYPPQPECLNCNQVLQFYDIENFCNDCLDKIEFSSVFCPVCGRERKKGEICEQCQNNDLYFDKARSVGIYKGLMRDMIIDFKYEGKIKYVEVFGELLYLFYENYYRNNNINFILPVPLHERRKSNRGFNQSFLLANKLHEYSRIPLLKNYMLRVRNNPALYNFSYSERKQILENIFVINKDFNLAGSTVLIIDDIFTTGSTVNEVGKVLKEEVKVKNVFVLTLATGGIKVG